jgi:hypothetical protein
VQKYPHCNVNMHGGYIGLCAKVTYSMTGTLDHSLDEEGYASFGFLCQYASLFLYALSIGIVLLVVQWATG